MNGKYPLVGAIVTRENGVLTTVAKLYGTPNGLVWEGEGPSHLMKAAEQEILKRFEGVLHKLPLYEGVEFSYKYDPAFMSEGDFEVRLSERRYFDRLYERPMIDITKEYIEQYLENRFWKGHGFKLGEDIIQLEGKKRLVRHYGKYMSNLSILVEVYSDYSWLRSPDLSQEMNIRFDGMPYVMRGEYFVSKKGTKCFRVKKDGPHFLIRNEWGGAFNDTRGFTSSRQAEIEGIALYFRRASSNGGGLGNDYIVLPVGFRRTLREEDVI